jgi:hypothetical protein
MPHTGSLVWACLLIDQCMIESVGVGTSDAAKSPGSFGWPGLFYFQAQADLLAYGQIRPQDDAGHNQPPRIS